MIVLQQIYLHSQNVPNKVALISDKEDKVTYSELIQHIAAYADFLVGNGVSKGDNVMLSASKELEFVYAYFACHLIGAKAVVVDAESNPKRLTYIRSLIVPKLSFGFMHDENSIAYFQPQGTPLVDFVHLIDAMQSETISDIIFTTGTTGNPKGVLLSQDNIACAVRNINHFIGTNCEDVELLALPICHSFGLGRLRCVLSAGATLILLGSFANLKTFFYMMDKYCVTGFGMVPAVWNYIRKFSGARIADHANHLRYIEIGSAPMSTNNKKFLMDIFPNVRICMHYGLTEASRSAFTEFHSDKEHLDSIGKSSPNTEIVFMDETGKPVKNGEEGELCVKAGHVMKSYFLDEENNNSRYGDFFRTGDWGKYDTDGYCYLVGRKKELINTGGKKVAPQEIEDCINELESIADCICIGVPDPAGILGDVIKVFVKVASNHELDKSLIKAHVKAHLEAYKIPAIIEQIEEIPLTQSGKKQRLMLH